MFAINPHNRPAKVVRAKSILFVVGVEEIGPVLQNEVRVPVEALVTLLRLAHIAAV